MIRAVRLLNLRRARRQPVRAAITVVAVAAGVSLAITVVVLITSLNRSLDDFGRTVAGPTPLRVIGANTRGGLDEALLPKVRATEGVDSAVPVVQTVVLTDGGAERNLPVVAFGVDCSIEAVLSSIGCSPEAVAGASDAAPPLTSPSLLRRLGADAVVRTDRGRIALAGAPTVAELDRLNDGRVVVFPLPVAQRQLYREGALDAIYVKPAPGTEVATLRSRLETVVGPWNAVLGAADPPPQAGSISQIFVPLFGMLALVALGIGGLLVYNTMTLAIEERRQQLAITAALGAPNRVLLGGLLAEAGALGLVGGMLGTLAALAVARSVVDSMNRSFVEKILGVPISVHLTGTALVAGVVLGCLLAVVAAAVPARRALRMDVAAQLSNRELREESSAKSSRRRAVTWALVAAAGMAGCWLAQRDGALEPWQGLAAPVAFLVANVGLLAAAAAGAPLLIAGVLRGLRPPSAEVRLALANLVRDPGRTGTMAMAVAAAISVAFTVGSFNRSVADGNFGGISRPGDDWLAVSTMDPNNTVNIDSRTPPEVITALRTIPGVVGVEREAALFVGTEPGELHGIEGAEGQGLDFDLIAGVKDPDRFNRGEVMIGPVLARTEGVRPGDSLTVATPTGYAEVPVMGVWQDGDFGGRNVTMALPHIERLYGAQPPTEVIVRLAPGADPEEMAQRIGGARLDPALTVDTPQQRLDRSAADVNRLISPFWVLQRALLFVAFVAILSTLLLVGVQRRRELGLLSAVGMRPGELARMVVSEAAAAGATGTVLAIAVGLGLTAAFQAIMPVVVGFKGAMSLDLLAFPLYSAVGLAVVVAAGVLPAWRTTRLQVVEALQYE